MRIAILTPGYSSPADKWAIPALRNLVDTLGKSHDLELFALRYPFQPGIYQLGSTKVTALGGGTAAGFRRFPLLWHGWQALRAAHHRRPFDLIHGFWADEAGFLAVQAGAWLAIPAVVSLMGGELVGFPQLNYGGQLSFFNRWFGRLSLQNADLVTAGSRQLLEHAGKKSPRARLTYSPLGVDLARFRLRERAHNTPQTTIKRLSLLSVGSLVPIKDHTTMLQAVAQIRQAGHDFRLDLIGDGPLRLTLEHQAADLDLAGKVIFHGHITHTLLAAQYKTADIYLQSSHFESQGMAVLEAAASGVAVAGTATGILPELVPPAWTAPAGDAKALARVLAALLANPMDRETRAIEIAAHVREQYGVDATVGRLTGEYQSLIKG